MVVPASPVLKHEDSSGFSSSGLRESCCVDKADLAMRLPPIHFNMKHTSNKERKRKDEEESFYSFESEGEARSGLALPQYDFLLLFLLFLPLLLKLHSFLVDLPLFFHYT